jgi:hypothetical protein
MPVAKTYQKYPIVCEPFIDKGRRYVNINKDGSLKTVRWYSEKEYASMYKTSKKSVAPSVAAPEKPIVKDILGFKNGYITIFKTGKNDYDDYFTLTNARFATLWKWYIISTEELPDDLPNDVAPVRLEWNLVGNEDGTLKTEKEVKSAVESLLYPLTNSQFYGAIGDRPELHLTIAKTIPIETNWGTSTLHIMVDNNENEFIWKTNTKTLELGKEYHLKGTIKEHNLYKGSRQTVLTRCKIIE